MSRARVFLDTNVLIYSIGDLAEHSTKTARAISLLQEPGVGLSMQVLQEFYTQATRVTRRGHLSHRDAAELVFSWSKFAIQDITLQVMFDALSVQERYGFSYWDCAIIAAARALGCSILYTEDLTHGQVVDSVKIINPFV